MLGVIIHLLLPGVLVRLLGATLVAPLFVPVEVAFLGFMVIVTIVFAFFPFSTAGETLLSGFGSGVYFDDAFTIKLETVPEG